MPDANGNLRAPEAARLKVCADELRPKAALEQCQIPLIRRFCELTPAPQAGDVLTTTAGNFSSKVVASAHRQERHRAGSGRTHGPDSTAQMAGNAAQNRGEGAASAATGCERLRRPGHNRDDGVPAAA
jgi:hypothetical protein